jgi:pimeloyl-ACP methyl ester carboxylesterase
MIAVSCPGESSPEQGAYLLASQVACEGLSPEEAKHLEYAVEAAERAQTYEEFVKNQEVVLRYKTLLKKMGLNVGAIKPEEQWKPHRFKSEYFFNPMPIIEKTKIPVLAFFGEKDTQVDPIQGMKAYKSALEKAGNKNYRVELIPGVDHCMIMTKTGSLKEIFSRTRAEKLKYEPLFLDKIEEWLRNLYK